MKNLQNTLSELRRNKLVWNLLLIVLIILAMAVIAHFVMQAGTRHGARRTVPDFSGIALGEAQLTKTRLRSHLPASGIIRETSPNKQ